MNRQPEYWIQETQGSDPDDPTHHWSTVPVVFEDRADAEASVKRVQGRHPVRFRWPLGDFQLRGISARSRNKVAPLWWLRWDFEGSLAREVWERSPAFQSIDFADQPEACLVPVRVVYRVVSNEDLRKQGEDSWGRQNDPHDVGDFGFFARLYPPGERMTDGEIDARFSGLYPLEL